MDHVALITGGSSGIGYALANEFARHGYNLLLVARDEERLKKACAELGSAYQVQTRYLASDLRDSSAAETVYGFTRENQIEVDALVNNAGVGTYGDFSETFVDDNEAIVQLDVVTLIDLSYLFLHDMLLRKKGYILNVASTAAFQPGPKMAVYYASKAFVESFSEAIAEENRNSGVVISVLCPGPTSTPFLATTGMEKSQVVKTFKPLLPKEVAEYAYRKMMKHQVVIIPGSKNRFRAFAVRLFSRKWVREHMSEMTRLQNPKK